MAVSPTPTPTATATATATEAPPTPTVTATPVVEQVFRANLQAEPSTLDPQLASLATDVSVIRQVFDGLLGFGTDMGLMPVVAAAMPTVANGGISSDGLIYTFKIKQGVTWSDGVSVTASDFAYAIGRLLDPDLAARNAGQYFAIVGAMEYNGSVGADAQTRETLRSAVGVEAVDDETLRVTMARPDPTFLHKMALPFVYPVRRDIIEQHAEQWTEAGNYIGNGPFRMTEWAHQDHITLSARADYWGQNPLLDTIVLRMIGDPNAELAAYRNGELEISQVPPGTERSISEDATLSQELVRFSTLSTIGLFFNTTSPPFDNMMVRQAFATAIDRNAWVEKVKNGVGIAATSWLPPGMPGYDAEAGSEYEFDAARAQQLLADAGFPGGDGLPSITYTYIALQDQPVIAQFVQAQLKENLGVDVDLEPLDPPSFFQQVVGGRQFQVTAVGQIADYPDPESFLAPFFVSPSPNNISSYSNAEFDGLAGQAAAELDQQTRIGLWQRAHEIMLGEAPITSLFHDERFFLKKPGVQGLTFTGLDGAIPGDTRLGEVFLTP